MKLNLHAEVQVTIEVNVARSQEEAERQAKGEKLNSADANLRRERGCRGSRRWRVLREGAEDEDDRG